MPDTAPETVENGNPWIRATAVAARITRDVGFPVIVAAFLLYQLSPQLQELMRLQAQTNEILRGLATRSCVLPFQRWEPNTPPPTINEMHPQTFRNLGLRHARPLIWQGPKPRHPRPTLARTAKPTPEPPRPT